MNRNERGNLRLGSNVVELMLPQRRPFLMVDGVMSFTMEPRPALNAYRHINANETVFDGHFNGLHLWPAALTMEGLGQTGILLVVLVAMRRIAETEGADPEAPFEALRNLERGFRLEPGFRREEADAFRLRLGAAETGFAVGTSVELKFPRPVFAGQRLDYCMTLTGEHPAGVRFEAEASVEGSVVAKGVMMGALIRRPTAAP